MKRSIILVIPLSVVLAAAALAQQGDTPASKEDIQRLFEIMDLRQQMHSTMDSMTQQQADMLRESLKKRSPQITDAEIQRLDDAMHEMMKEFPYTAMLNDMIPVYQKHLTKADVSAMTLFYSSKTGKKLLREMPAMTAESMQAAYPTMQAHMEKVMKRIDEMANEDIDKKSTKPAPPQPKQ